MTARPSMTIDATSVATARRANVVTPAPLVRSGCLSSSRRLASNAVDVATAAKMMLAFESEILISSRHSSSNRRM
jgi:hypothetical protein